MLDTLKSANNNTPLIRITPIAFNLEFFWLLTLNDNELNFIFIFSHLYNAEWLKSVFFNMSDIVYLE